MFASVMIHRDGQPVIASSCRKCIRAIHSRRGLSSRVSDVDDICYNLSETKSRSCVNHVGTITVSPMSKPGLVFISGSETRARARARAHAHGPNLLLLNYDRTSIVKCTLNFYIYGQIRFRIYY